MNYFKNDIAAARNSLKRDIRTCRGPNLKQIIGKRLLIKIINVIENLSLSPYVFCYCNMRFGEFEACRLLADYENFALDKRSIRCLKFIVKCAVDISIRKHTLKQCLRDKDLISFLHNRQADSSYLFGVCIHDLQKTIDARQCFLEDSYYQDKNEWFFDWYDPKKSFKKTKK